MTGILVVAEQRRGQLIETSLECITAALNLKQSCGELVAVAIIAQDTEPFIAALSVEGVDEVISISSSQAEFQSDLHAATLLELITQNKPSLVLIPHSIDAWGYAPTVATQGRFGFASDVFAIRFEDNEWVATRAVYAEKIHAEMVFPGHKTVLLTIRANTFKRIETFGNPKQSKFEVPEVTKRTTHNSFIEPESGTEVDITQAEFMLSIGRGIDTEDNVEQLAELADSMNFTLGCSRPIADNGWLPKYRQVGQSGKTVSDCSIYLALGISGSVQHMAGMKHVPNIIAVNTDPEASIFSIAKYGVVADLFEIADELQEHFD